MKKYSHILVVAEPKKDIQVALKRALDIAALNPHSTITFLRVVYDFSSDIFQISQKIAPVSAELEESILSDMKETIEEYRIEANSEALIIPKIIKGHDIGQAIIKESNENGYDLIIKAANRHGILDSIIFTPIDWYILRNANVPVIIAKEHEWPTGGKIVVCVDFSLQQQLHLNNEMLREAQILSKITKGEIHLVNSAPIYLPSVMLEVPHYSPALYEQNILKDHERKLHDFASRHHIPVARCHIREGMPDEIIPAICQELDAKTVFIGSAGRQGFMAALIGNTCEEIVDDIAADLVVLNKKLIKDKDKLKA